MSAGLDLPTVAARARGLATHLLSRAALDELAGAPDVATLARALARADVLTTPIEPPATAFSIEAAVRHTAADRLRTLARWTGAAPALDLFYADQDRRSVRAMLRGAMQGAPERARLAGLLPTPRLPERALEELARQPSPAKVAAHLVVLRHPDAPRLLALATRAQPVLFDLEVALVKGFAARSVAAARAGDANLVRAARARVDACNIEMALTLAGGPLEGPARAAFAEGGAHFDARAFEAVASARSRAEAAARLVRATEATPLAALARASEGDPARLERSALPLALAAQRDEARLHPLGSAPLLSFLLRLEAQSRDVLRLAWGASLGAPASVVQPELVTPWR